MKKPAPKVLAGSLLTFFGALAALGAPLAATQVKAFRTQSQAGFLAGTLSGVSLDSLGRLELAPRAAKLAAIGEPFLFSAAMAKDGGWIVGTGNSGKLLAIDKMGKVRELFAAPEPEIFAVWVDADGTVFAGTSPRGKVYRQAPGGSFAPFFDPGETYIWALARAKDGGLLVATGTEGKLFKVDAAGKGQVIYDSDDTHLRSLSVQADGSVLVGTAGDGLLLRLDAAGQGRTIYDSKQPEVVAVTTAPDGSTYFAAVASEASLVETAKPAPAAPASGGRRVNHGAAGGAEVAGGAGGPGGQPAVSVTVEPEAGAPPAGGHKDGTPRSEIFRLSPNGAVEKVWSFSEETVYSLLWQGGSLWVGTGLEGKLFRFDGDRMALVEDLDDRQIVALLPSGRSEDGPSFATTNGAALYRLNAGREATGTYTSAPLETGGFSRFGVFRWRGEAPKGSSLRFSFRSGVSGEPDKTWSPWVAESSAGSAGSATSAGDEIALTDLPPGRYVQWRAELRAAEGKANGAGSPNLFAIELSYRQENLAPHIDNLAVLEPGQILVPASFNPGNQVFEPAHPNRDGIFTTLGDNPDEGRVKPLWKLGYRALRWAASDPNDDKLVYSLWFRPAAPGGDGPGDWLKVADDLAEDHYNFDATVLPDGVYRFRLVVSDRLSNDPREAKSGEQVSEPVVVDHSPPVLVKAEVAAGVLRVTVKDDWSSLREVVASVNAGDWQPVRAADGLIDGKTETVLLAPAPPGGLLLLRVTDAAYNVVTFDLSNRR